LQKYSPECDNISPPSAEHSKLGDSPGLGVEACSDLGDSLCQEDCSELAGSPGQGVGDSYALGGSLGEQLSIGLAQEHLPAEHVRQLGQRLVQVCCNTPLVLRWCVER